MNIYFISMVIALAAFGWKLTDSSRLNETSLEYKESIFNYKPIQSLGKQVRILYIQY